MSTGEEENNTNIKENIDPYNVDYPARYEYKYPLIYYLEKNEPQDEVMRITCINHIICMMTLLRLEVKKFNLRVDEYNERKKFHVDLIGVIKDLSDTLKFASIRGPEYLSAKRSFENAAKESQSIANDNAIDSLD